MENNRWSVLHQFTQDAGLGVGDTFKTTLLGRVLWQVVDGEFTGWIPPYLYDEALKNGFLIEAALWKEGYYVVRILDYGCRAEMASNGIRQAAHES